MIGFLIKLLLPDKVRQVAEDGALVHDGARHALGNLDVVRLLVEVSENKYPDSKIVPIEIIFTG